MKKSEMQKFQDFKKRHKLSNQQIASILTEYANSNDEFAASFYAMKHKITEYVFYKIRDYCIIFMLVDAYVCQRIRNKSFRNQSGKNQAGNYTAAKYHYQALMEKRREYLKSFSPEEITLVAIEYANGDALYDIAKRHNVSVYTVRKLLEIALVNHLVCEKVYLSIKRRSDSYIIGLKHYAGYTAEDLWNRKKTNP